MEMEDCINNDNKNSNSSSSSSSELWASLLSATKRRILTASHHHHHRHHHSLDRTLGQDMDVDDDTRFELICPYCYSEFNIASLCSHLDEEHCFESKPVLCPVCTTRVNNDLVGHITLQHGNLFKKRGVHRKGLTSSEPCSTYISLDPLISSILCDFSTSETGKVSQFSAASEETVKKKSLSSQQKDTSSETPISRRKSEQKVREEELKVKFVQQMVLSTVFYED